MKLNQLLKLIENLQKRVQTYADCAADLCADEQYYNGKRDAILQIIEDLEMLEI